MGFFDISGLAKKMVEILKRKKVEEKPTKPEELEVEIPKEILKKMEKDPDLLNLYYNLEEENKKIIIKAVESGKIFDKKGLKRTVQKIIKSGITDDIVLALNYYSLKRYGKEFLELPEPKQQEIMYRVMKGIPENKLLQLYNQVKNEQIT